MHPPSLYTILKQKYSVFNQNEEGFAEPDYNNEIRWAGGLQYKE